MHTHLRIRNGAAACLLAILCSTARAQTAPGISEGALVQAATPLQTAQPGRDLLLHAKGDQHRRYPFAEAGETMPYRLYVPDAWTPSARLPLVVSLHGGGQDENSTMDNANGLLRRLAEAHGAIVVAPLGYSPSAGYGEPFPVPTELQSTLFGMKPPVTTSLRTYQLSEKDVLNVMDQVIAEYGVDTGRVYLVGNSAGGGGTWILAARFPERFAAAAPCASSMDIRGVPFERLRGVPLLVCVGDLDVDARREVARYGVAKVNEAGGDARYLPVPGGTHGSAIEMAMPPIFDFFFRYRKFR